VRATTLMLCSEHGVFQAVMKFPQDYPMSPPSLTFTSEFWHPNGTCFARNMRHLFDRWID